MRRRDLVLASGAWMTLVAARARAQSPKVPRLIGWLFSFTRESQKVVLKDFTAELERLGHVEGRDFAIEGRWSDGSNEKLPALAKELVALRPAAIITAGTPAIAALKKATDSVPIVFAGVFDPVASGFVASLRRPGGNITGVAIRTELDGKIVELVRETLPAVRRVALLEHDNHPAARQNAERLRHAATALRFEASSLRVERIDEIERAFAAAAKDKVGALIETTTGFSILHAQTIGAAAAKARLPLFSTLRSTAKALGIKIPQTVLLRADEVIE